MNEYVWETCEELDKKIADRVRLIRKRRAISQEKLSKISNVSLGSIKRFETTGQISLLSLTKIAVALNIADDLRNIFTEIPYNSIEEVINVGTLAMTNERKAAFEYADEWLENGFSISPFSLPLEKKVCVPVKEYFNGLWGVFADSLPDAWGQLLLDRMLKEKGCNIDNVSMLDRLAIVGESGMGALTYRPEWDMPKQEKLSSLDELSEQCQKILNTEYSDKLDELYRLGGTSGGARPKIMTKIDGEDWIIKFPAHVDGKNAGLMEYRYSQCAKQCGIDMEETRLFPSDICCLLYTSPSPRDA